MANVWWINHKGTYERGRDAGVVYAGFDSDKPVRTRVYEMSPKDITVHSPSGCVAAIGRVETYAEKRRVPFRDEPGRVADVDYYEFPDPINLHLLGDEIFARDIPNRPIYKQAEDTYFPKPGYCHPFSHKALAVIRELSNTWPPWPQARFPAKTQVAADSIETEEHETEPSPPKTREYEVSRIIRDSQLARTVKEKNEYVCQLCGADPIELPDGSLYAEAHHLHPLSNGGPDEEENLLCVCPECHVKLDYGLKKLDAESLEAGSNSRLHHKHVQYHNRRVAEKANL